MAKGKNAPIGENKGPILTLSQSLFSLYYVKFETLRAYTQIPIALFNILFIYVLTRLYKTDHKVIQLAPLGLDVVQSFSSTREDYKEQL